MDNIPNLPIQPDQIIEIIKRRRWFIIIPFCLSMIVGTYFAFTLPKVYSAETLILVEPQRVPTSYVQSLVSEDMNARVSTISQQIMSRTNLESIIEKFNLYSDTKFKHMFLEDKVEDIRKKIRIHVTRARSGGDAFSIAFEGNDPEKVMRIVNTLATYFIDANIKVREEQAIGTDTFLEGELVSMRKKLEEAEEAMKIYREEHMGELPEQLQTNLTVLNRVEEQLVSKEQQLSDAKNRLIEIDNLLSIANSQYTTSNQGQATIGEPSNLMQLKEQLARLKVKYKDHHPDVIKLTKMIANIEKEIAQQGTSGNTSTEVPLVMSREAANYFRQKNEVKREINGLIKEIDELQHQKELYKVRVENTPKREQELLSLNRDYSNIQTSYSSLLGRKLEAEIAVNMERKQKGEQFRVLDVAKVPEKPIKPDMKKLLIMALAAGLGIGGGIIFLLEFLDTSFRDTESVEKTLELPVLTTIPSIVGPEDIKKQRLQFIFSLISIGISFVLFMGFLSVVAVGPDKILEAINRYQ